MSPIVIDKPTEIINSNIAYARPKTRTVEISFRKGDMLAKIQQFENMPYHRRYN